MASGSLLVGLDIQTDVILVVAVAKRHPEQIIFQFEVALSEPVLAYGQLVNLELLQDKLYEIAERLPMNSEYLISLAENQTLTQHLKLPKGIKSYEYDMIVSNSLTRLFALKETEIVYDYIANEDELTITVAKRQTITLWQNLFTKLNRKLICISVKHESTERDLENNCPFFHAQQLTILYDKCINFLPWRAKVLVFRRYCFLLLCLLYLTISLIFFVFIEQYYRDLKHSQMSLVDQLTAELELKKARYIKQNDINNRRMQFTKAQYVNQQIAASTMTLLKHLINIANALPERVWLEKLEYHNFIFQLAGKALVDEELTHFILQLCHQPTIKDCQLKRLAQPDANGLAFEIEIDTREDKGSGDADELF